MHAAIGFVCLLRLGNVQAPARAVGPSHERGSIPAEVREGFAFVCSNVRLWGTFVPQRSRT